MAEYDYDLFVIGGGSGGLACSKQAASHGARVAVADFVKPSPAGTTWGLGGTCVNVGCIPKKLMHLSALMREAQSDAHGLGWETKASHSWETMLKNINNYIKSLNFGYRTELRSKKVKYYNKFATFVDPHKLALDDGKGGAPEYVTAKNIVLATGGRPNLGGYEGAEECCISSDDIFWLKKPPGKTLVVGASYIALECAGFLATLGFDTTVMVRSILLRGFDQDSANKIGDFMEKHGTKFVRGKVPSKFEKTPEGDVKVFVDGQEFGVYNTVLLAIGRTGCAGWVNLEAAGVPYDKKSGKIQVNKEEQTCVPHIYGIGDVLEGQLELTPVAIQAGRLLASRLFNGAKKLMDYDLVATTVFTPIEYGAVGLSEEDAETKLGKDGMIIYHTYAKPLEWNLNSERGEDLGYIKVICDKKANDKVVGIHMLAPNAGEIIQGLGVAMKCGLHKEHLDDCVGIHPTFAESYTTISEVKEAGKVLEMSGGC
jgi:thioredoxin reductase (NADPH)